MIFSTLVHRQLNHCTVYAVISERLVGRTRNVTVCGTIARERNVYLSMTNSIDIALVHTVHPNTVPTPEQLLDNEPEEDTSPAFLLKYRGELMQQICELVLVFQANLKNLNDYLVLGILLREWPQ